jgi:hypothetical protein
LGIARALVAFLLDGDNQDDYAFIAAVHAHPQLLDEFPQLADPDRYEDGANLMAMSLMAADPRLENLHRSITPPEDLETAVAELLDAFQGNVSAVDVGGMRQGGDHAGQFDLRDGVAEGPQ